MISYPQARTLLEAHAPALPAARRSPAAALGEIAASDVLAGFAVPSFDNSAMDGFAVRAADCARASAATPLRLPVCGFLAAGGALAAAQPGQAVQIMTGAPVPPGSDAVIPIEKVTVARREDGAADAITLTSPPEPGANIRRSGEDWRKGDVILRAGEVITPHHVMALAALGHGTIFVRKLPRIIVLTTGDEVLSSLERHGEPPGGSRIYDSNGPFLLTAIRQLGADASHAGHIGDSRAGFVQALRAVAGQAEMVVSTGAVSKGDLDFVPDALADMGARIIFHGVAIRPGKPLLFALLPGGTPFFGLPGNPVSVLVGFRFFAVPLLRAALGLPPERPWRLRLAGAHAGKPGLCQFLKARWWLDEDGMASVAVLAGQESFRIRPLLRANGWIMCGEAEPSLAAGQLVDFYPAAPLAAGGW